MIALYFVVGAVLWLVANYDRPIPRKSRLFLFLVVMLAWPLLVARFVGEGVLALVTSR